MSRKIGTGKGIPDNSPRGVALIMVLLAVLVLSTLTAAIVFTTRAETLSAFNYRIVSQAEYAAMAIVLGRIVVCAPAVRTTSGLTRSSMSTLGNVWLSRWPARFDPTMSCSY